MCAFSLELLKWGTATVCTSVSDIPSAWQLVHMDLKPANILLQDKNCLVAKIADLGLSSYLAEGRPANQSRARCVHPG